MTEPHGTAGNGPASRLHLHSGARAVIGATLDLLLGSEGLHQESVCFMGVTCDAGLSPQGGFEAGTCLRPQRSARAITGPRLPRRASPQGHRSWPGPQGPSPGCRRAVDPRPRHPRPRPRPHSPSRLSAQGVPGARPCLGGPEGNQGKEVRAIVRSTRLGHSVPHQATQATASRPRTAKSGGRGQSGSPPPAHHPQPSRPP